MAFYVTTPIFYVNAAPHLGHAYTTIAADVVARHMRQRGEDVFFLTGTDEHGEPVALAAEREGVTPRELADRNAERFRALMPVLGASNDFFIRTSDPEHERAVQDVLQRVHDNGHVYKGLYEGWYCPRCADFKSETEIGPGTTCPIHGIELTREQEENWFFRLSTFQQALEELLATDFVQPQARANEARAFVAQGLQDVSLTRGKITWGVPVPWDDGHVFYVWFDALLNYYTALTYAREGEDLTPRFWGAPTQHLIGKDILKFHTIYWPALLLAAGLDLPGRVFIHGFLLGHDGRKMSKSDGNVLDPFEVIDRFGTDALRYYLMRDVAFGEDGSVSMAGVERRYETELANDLGNLASRTIAMVSRYRDGTVPSVRPDESLTAGLQDEVARAMDAWRISDALEAIWQRVRRLNGYVEEQAPWKLAKDDARSADLDRVLASLVAGLRTVAQELLPFLPDTMARLTAALDAGRLEPMQPLFPKRRDDDAAAA
ncbi:MAG TPA: methionine--tRNA ligase [Solirubrobacteraceae bacterium]|jgi:methionyl-tRNA synthetase|nr:methionine--tRNA ligase [Solirubrobacteraceae bacterium]